MPAVDRFSVGAPCWADLSTPDVDGSRAFYSQLFGWDAQEPSEEFGGYFMFTRDGAPVAGGMGPMGEDMPANNAWNVYLSTDDIARVAADLVDNGAELLAGPMEVSDLGQNLVFVDPTGAHLGAWQPETFPGFAALSEEGAPSWFELFTPDYAKALDFYRSVFSWKTEIEGDSDEFRYSTLRDPVAGTQLAGVMDASAFLPDGAPAHWSVYWHVADVDAKVHEVESLGGSLVDPPMDTPYGRMSTVTDPSGAMFKLHTPLT